MTNSESGSVDDPPADDIQLASKIPQARAEVHDPQLFREQYRDDGVRRVEAVPKDLSPCFQRGT